MALPPPSVHSLSVRTTNVPMPAAACCTRAFRSIRDASADQFGGTPRHNDAAVASQQQEVALAQALRPRRGRSGPLSPWLDMLRDPCVKLHQVPDRNLKSPTVIRNDRRSPWSTYQRSLRHRRSIATFPQ